MRRREYSLGVPVGPRPPDRQELPVTFILKGGKRLFELNGIFLLEIFSDHTPNFFNALKPKILKKERCVYFYKWSGHHTNWMEIFFQKKMML